MLVQGLYMEERVIRFNPILSVKNTLAYDINVIVQETLKEFMPDRRFYIKTIDLDLTSENRNLAVEIQDEISTKEATVREETHILDYKGGCRVDFIFSIKDTELMNLLNDTCLVDKRFFALISDKWYAKRFNQKSRHLLLSSDYMIGENGRLYKLVLEQVENSYPELNVYTNNPETGKFDEYVGLLEGIEKIDYVDGFVYCSIRGGSTMVFQPIKVKNLFIAETTLK